MNGERFTLDGSATDSKKMKEALPVHLRVYTPIVQTDAENASKFSVSLGAASAPR
jgi:hypothetical protein